MNTIVTVLCFLLILCVIVVVHEGGHALVARLTGMRVTEFYVGMPYGPEKSYVSKRSGIRYGATLALLGGYTRICGMAFSQDKRMALALALVNARPPHHRRTRLGAGLRPDRRTGTYRCPR